MKDFNCKYCGAPETDHWNEGDIKNIMTEEELCFNCAFWEIHARYLEKNPDDKTVFIIDHCRYHDGGTVDKSKVGGFLGHGGRNFKIKRYDSEEIYTTNNLWCQGDVPEFFWDRLPNNAEFIN